MTRLRFKLGVWLLKPHWLPLLEHYTEMADDTLSPGENRHHCDYICVGIRYVVQAGRKS